MKFEIRREERLGISHKTVGSHEEKTFHLKTLRLLPFTLYTVFLQRIVKNKVSAPNRRKHIAQVKQKADDDGHVRI